MYKKQNVFKYDSEKPKNTTLTIMYYKRRREVIVFYTKQVLANRYNTLCFYVIFGFLIIFSSFLRNRRFGRN